MTLAFYLDDNFERRALTRELHLRGVDVLRATDAGNHAASDEAHLRFAARVGRAIVTGDKDFHRIHWNWAAQQRHHAGIIMVAPDLSIGECVAALCAVYELDAGALDGQLVFLKQWVHR